MCRCEFLLVKNFSAGRAFAVMFGSIPRCDASLYESCGWWRLGRHRREPRRWSLDWWSVGLLLFNVKVVEGDQHRRSCYSFMRCVRSDAAALTERYYYAHQYPCASAIKQGCMERQRRSCRQLHNSPRNLPSAMAMPLKRRRAIKWQKAHKKEHEVTRPQADGEHSVRQRTKMSLLRESISPESDCAF